MADNFRIYKKDGTKVSEGASPLAIDGMTVGQKAADGDYYAVQVVSDTEESEQAPIPGFEAMGVPGAPTIKATAADGAFGYTITAPDSDGASGDGANNIDYYTINYTETGNPSFAHKQVTDLTGTVTGTRNGHELTINVTAHNAAGDGAASDDVTVTPAAPAVAVTGVTLDHETLSVKVGAAGQLAATVAPDNATDKAVAWSSSDETVATVDNAGKVTGVKAGTATITAASHADGTKKATSEVTVTA